MRKHVTLKGLLALRVGWRIQRDPLGCCYCEVTSYGDKAHSAGEIVVGDDFFFFGFAEESVSFSFFFFFLTTLRTVPSAALVSATGSAAAGESVSTIFSSTVSVRGGVGVAAMMVGISPSTSTSIGGGVGSRGGGVGRRREGKLRSSLTIGILSTSSSSSSSSAYLRNESPMWYGSSRCRCRRSRRCCGGHKALGISPGCQTRFSKRTHPFNILRVLPAILLLARALLRRPFALLLLRRSLVLHFPSQRSTKVVHLLLVAQLESISIHAPERVDRRFEVESFGEGDHPLRFRVNRVELVEEEQRIEDLEATRGSSVRTREALSTLR